MAATSETGTCPSCRSTVRFVTDGRGGSACPVCGAARRLSEDAPDTGPRPRVARRVVDVDSGGSSTSRKGSTGSRPPTKMPVSTRREAPGARSVTGALDGTAGGRVGSPATAELASARSLDARSSLTMRWQALTDGLQSRDGRPWRELATYEAGDIILHTRYGMGVVERVVDDGTLDVLFRAGYQRLPAAHSRATAPETASSH
jgi:hypothetical protein